MDAIRKEDVSEIIEEVVEELSEEPRLSAHEAEIERIAESIEKEPQEVIEEVEEEEQEFVSPAYQKGDEWYVTAKVDGELVEVSYENILAQYQKNSTADKRLQEAAERQRELAEYEAKLNNYRTHLESSRPSQDAEKQASPSSDANTDALYEQYHDALFQGEEAKASNLLKQIRNADKPAPQIDVQSIIDRTKAEMREEEKTAREQGYELRRQQAVELFKDEYSDIAEDTSLLAVADRRSAELYQNDPTRDPWEIMQESGDFAREWIMSYADELGGNSDDTRQERKQNMDEVTPKNVRAHIGEDTTEPTYSDVIAEMRKERGQPA
jgi:hypothetical protein